MNKLLFSVKGSVQTSLHFIFIEIMSPLAVIPLKDFMFRAIHISLILLKIKVTWVKKKPTQDNLRFYLVCSHSLYKKVIAIT